MTALCNTHSSTKTALNLCHVCHASHTDHLQHTVIVSRPHELIITLRTPRVGPRRPADYTNKLHGLCNDITL